MTYSVSMNPYLYNSLLLSSFYPPAVTAPTSISSNNMGVLSSAYASANQFAKAQANALIGLANYASQLKSSAATLDASSLNSAWNQRSITSSAPTSVSGTAANGAKIASYTVNVSQIAVAQQSAGTALNSAAVTTLTPGTQTFSVTSAGVVNNISFSVITGDTNQTVLTKMSQSINAANTGVSASVTTNTITGTSQLLLTSKNTGTVNAFSLVDVSGTAVATSGANTILKAAANATYSVNGISYTSSKNTVLLTDPKVSLNLLSPVTNATVTVGNNNDSITTAITNFTNSYNNIVTYLSQNKQYISPQLANTLISAFSNNAFTLQKAGITSNPDGTLKVDQTLLSNSIKNNPTGLMQPLNGFSGLSKISKDLAERISSSPLSTFAKSPVYSILPRTSIYSTRLSTYSQLLGILFNKVI